MIVEVIGEVLMPKFLSQIINEGVNKGNWQYVAGTCALMILTAVLMMAGGIGGAYFGAKASVNFATDVRRDVFSKIQSFAFANIDKFSTGSLVTRLTNDVTQIQNFVNMLLRMFLRAPGMLIGALFMAIALRPSLAVVLAVAIPVLFVVLLIIIRIGFPRFGIMQDKVDGLNSNIQENITNVRVVKSFVRRDFEIKKFRKSNGDLKACRYERDACYDLYAACYDPADESHYRFGTVVRRQACHERRDAGRRPYRIYYLYYSDTHVTYYGNDDVYVLIACNSFGAPYIGGFG